MKRIMLLFPGQGTQRTGMGKDFYERYASARRVFERADEILHLDIKKLCIEGNSELLKQTSNAQLAILTAGVAMFEAYKEEIGIVPVCSAGHSLGEYTALVCSGALEFDEALKLVRFRGELMSQAPAGRMISVRGIDADKLIDMMPGFNKNGSVAAVACFNSSMQNVVSVSESCAEAVTERIEAEGGSCYRLPVSSGFHSGMMREAAQRLKEEIDKCFFSMPKWDVISNVTAMPYVNAAEIKARLVQHMVCPVKWREIMDYAYMNGIRYGVEIGEGKVLKGLADARRMEVYSMNSVDSLNRIMDEIGSLNTVKKDFIRKCVRDAVSLPNLNFSAQSYRDDVEKPCKKLKELYSGRENYTHADLLEAWHLLGNIVKYKKVKPDEAALVRDNVLSALMKSHIETDGFEIGEWNA